jgi:hypothetical protein
LLSPVVLGVVHVFHLYDVEFWLVVSVESVGLPSITMCGDRGEVRCCCLSKGWNGGDGWNPLAKD